MKTAISIDDKLLHEADETARRMGLSRSGLFVLAVDNFLEQQRQAQMLQSLNDVYAAGMEPGEKRVLKAIKAKVRGTLRDRW
jgi:metal-responsive CopG/Arc/MetJ family transcriptional regulator